MSELAIVACVTVVIAAWAGVKQWLGIQPRREPRTDVSPFLASLASGIPRDAWTAPVAAVTPDGITARRRRCCDRGHLSAAQAVAHAQAVAARIERTGR